MFLMKSSVAAIVVALSLVASGSADAALGRAKSKVRHGHVHPIALAAMDQPTASDCRMVTQTVTHQGIAHTRKVKVCQPTSKWEAWLGRAKREMLRFGKAA